MNKSKFISLIFIFILCSSITSISAPRKRVFGFVRDSQTNEALIGANIWECGTLNGTTTDNNGYFNLSVTKSDSLTASYIGYKSNLILINSNSDTILTVLLETDNLLEEVVVHANFQSPFETVRLSASELQQIPSIGGKPDVLKTLQMFPGVQAQSEGSSIMLVRGGDPGQNQYLLDNIPLIYVNHLGGFMSVFNPDMINTVDFYKGNFPAKYGGKLSSIIDITQRAGDVSKHQGSFSIGITDAGFSFEGPLFKKKGSYIVTARKTFTEIPMALFSFIGSDGDNLTTYGFHDINAKLTWKPNAKNNFSFNLYQGDDYLSFYNPNKAKEYTEKSKFTQQWGNWLASVRWNHVVNSKLFTENTISFSRYRNMEKSKYTFSNDLMNVHDKSLNRSSVQDILARSLWKYSFLKNWNIDFGAEFNYSMYEPSYIRGTNKDETPLRNLTHSFETALFIDNKINLFSFLQFQPSLRFVNYYNAGTHFPTLEPRIGLSFSPTSNHRINLNYMMVSQPSHLIFAQSNIIKKEIWLPATKEFSPQQSQQYSISWEGKYFNRKYSSEISFYYKKMRHLVSLKEGYENMIGITGFDNKLERNGIGTAYGAELTLKKNIGKFTGSISYAYSYSTRQYENINSGNSFEYEYNRPHNLYFNANYQINKAWSLSLNWIYQSGLAYTPAYGKQYTIDIATGKPTIELMYGEKNSIRLKSYHRLDLGLNYTYSTKKGHKAVWTFSIYNAYNRKNPYNYYYQNDSTPTDYSQPLQLYQISLFPIIPSIAYKVYFDYSKKDKKEEVVKKRRNWLYFE